MKHPIIQQLRDERRGCGRSQFDVAEKSGTLHNQLARWENGHHMPRLDLLTAWAGSLGYELTLVKKP